MQIVTGGWLRECCASTVRSPASTWRDISPARFTPKGISQKENDQPITKHLPKPSENSSKPKYTPLDALAPPVAKNISKNVSRRSWAKIGVLGFDVQDLLDECETPESKKDQNEPRTSDIHRGLTKAVRESNQEHCQKNKIGIYSKSAIKQKEERMKFPKTPKMQVTKNNVLIRPQGKINNFCRRPHL